MRTPAGMREEVFYKRVTWKKAGASFGVRFRTMFFSSQVVGRALSGIRSRTISPVHVPSGSRSGFPLGPNAMAAHIS